MTSIEQLVFEKRVDALFADIDGKLVPGYAVGVARGSDLLLAKGYGLANVEHRVPMQADTAFRIASVTKQFTVTGALMLAAKGRIALDDDVRQYLPELGPLPSVVTLAHLMSNTSGLPDMLELWRLGGAGISQSMSRAALLATIARCHHLNFAPGSRFLYSNSNFLLLGLVIERVSGHSLDEYLQAHVLRPLGMNRTALVKDADAVVSRLASPYLPDGGAGFRRAVSGLEHGGEGGLVSTVEDLLIWGRHFDQPCLVPLDLAAQLAAPTRLNGGAAAAYSRGIEHGHYRGVATLGHGGLWPGYRTEFLRIPDAQLTVAVIANSAAADPYRLAREVAAAALVGEPRFAAMSTPPAAAAPAALAGTWCAEDEPSLLELDVQGGRLMASQWGATFALMAEADGSFTALRGAYEFRLRASSAEVLELDVGAGRALRLRKLANRSGVPVDLAGRYECTDLAAIWTIAPTADGDTVQLRASGPVVSDGGPWAVRGVSGDLLELRGQDAWFSFNPLLRVERDSAGRVSGLRVDTGRVKSLRFARLP